MKKYILVVLLALFVAVVADIMADRSIIRRKIGLAIIEHNLRNTPITLPTPTLTISKISPTATPTAKPISFAEMNLRYGPCTNLPVLMYHHVEDEKEAKENHRQNLNVTPEYFREQMEYLKVKGYNVVGSIDLVNFFNQGMALPAKPVMITLDDGYVDNYTNAYPILKEYGYKATIFTATGLIQNPDYLTWNQIQEMSNSGLFYFANHTWSHHSSAGSLELQDKEISLADTQLKDHGLNGGKVFAYPYGNPSTEAQKILTKYGYNMAFTTVNGRIMCKGQKYTLPRVRVGSAPLSRFGL